LDLIVEILGIVSIKHRNFASGGKPPRVGEVKIPEVEIGIAIVGIECVFDE
jgi:hypothetical protein